MTHFSRHTYNALPCKGTTKIRLCDQKTRHPSLTRNPSASANSAPPFVCWFLHSYSNYDNTSRNTSRTRPSACGIAHIVLSLLIPYQNICFSKESIQSKPLTHSQNPTFPPARGVPTDSETANDRAHVADQVLSRPRLPHGFANQGTHEHPPYCTHVGLPRVDPFVPFSTC